MKILRYLLLLLLLFAFGTAIFVATQKPTYSVTRSIFIKNPRSVVYDYVDNIRNWETFAAWILEDNGIQYAYSGNAAGKGAKVTWTGNREGSLISKGGTFQKSLVHVMNEEGRITTFQWQFKDSAGGTKISFKCQGHLDFNSKAKAFFNGGVQSTMGKVYERTLQNLNTSLHKEINTYSIQVGKAVDRPRVMCLKQYARCSDKDVTRTIKTLLPRMQLFFDKNKIARHGKPFIVYHQFDRSTHQVALSVCMPVRDSIHIAEGSDITFMVYPPFKALKVTLKGDYSHSQQSWKKGFQYINNKKWLRLTHLNILEVYRKSMEDTPHPSQWETDVYLPVQPINTRVSIVNVSDSLSTKTPVIPNVN
ncbi:MAG: hypothetical protein RL607_1177 [Bacteroidota bacterium]|jgi:effector-binding domain-containing protein